MWNAGRINWAGYELSWQLDSGVLFFSFNPKPFSFKDRILESCQCYCSQSIVLDVSAHRVDRWVRERSPACLGHGVFLRALSPVPCSLLTPVPFWPVPSQLDWVLVHLCPCLGLFFCLRAWRVFVPPFSKSPVSVSSGLFICSFLPNADRCPALCYIDLSCRLMGDHLSWVLSLPCFNNYLSPLPSLRLP